MNSKDTIKRIEPEEVKTPDMNRPDYDYGYKDRPLNTKRSNYNTYLEWVSAFWSVNLTWININDTITPTSNCTIIPLTQLYNYTGNLSWKLSNDWWLIIPTDWTYLLSFQRLYLMSPTISDATIQWAYWTKPLVSLIYQLDNLWDTPTSFWFVRSQTFWTVSQNDSFTLSWPALKWSVFYALASSKRAWQTFPAYAVIYINKLT